jgi:hypothetical protein
MTPVCVGNSSSCFWSRSWFVTVFHPSPARPGSTKGFASVWRFGPRRCSARAPSSQCTAVCPPQLLVAEYSALKIEVRPPLGDLGRAPFDNRFQYIEFEKDNCVIIFQNQNKPKLTSKRQHLPFFRLTSCALHTHTHLTPQQWLLCHLGIVLVRVRVRLLSVTEYTSSLGYRLCYSVPLLSARAELPKTEQATEETKYQPKPNKKLLGLKINAKQNADYIIRSFQRAPYGH